MTQARPISFPWNCGPGEKLREHPVLQRFGYGGLAAVTAIPATRNGRPFRVTRSPTPAPSASAKVRSSTTPPGRTQLPAVSFGWSAEAAAWSRPSASTAAVRPCARSTAPATGYGPLWPGYARLVDADMLWPRSRLRPRRRRAPSSWSVHRLAQERGPTASPAWLLVNGSLACGEMLAVALAGAGPATHVGAGPMGPGRGCSCGG